MTAPAQDWAEKAREVYADSMWSSPDVSLCNCNCHGPSEANVEHHIEAIALALSDAARTGRDEGLEEAKRGLLEMADHLQSDAPLSAGAIRNSAELLSALRGKERS